LLANHDLASQKLATALDEIEKLVQSHENNVQPLFCTANFMSYGLYKENSSIDSSKMGDCPLTTISWKMLFAPP
jgi:hypothetical protein